MSEPTIFELSSPGRTGVTFPQADVPSTPLPDTLIRENLPLPELSEVDVVRHFTRLSRMNYCIDYGIYPLGSCTMKYNPRINEATARFPGFAYTHPLQPEETIQGNLYLMYHLQEWLKEIAGFSAVSLQPAAGAHGELTGILMIRAYHQHRGDTKRTRVLIPDSAHGTNPATSAMSGFEVVPVPTDKNGNVDLEILRSLLDDTIAGIMLTNPNTLGLFEQNILEVTKLVHQVGGLVYGDGANLNALLGIARPGDLGIDVMHFNLHKTFSTPHGGGGPGAGPVGASERLKDFLPGPIVEIVEEGNEDYPPLYGFREPKYSIGRVKSFYGHFGIMIRAYTYIAMHGPEGLRKVAENAVINANYLQARLRGTYKIPYDRICMHEFVVEGKWADAPEIIALDISKRLMDYDFHPPTNYFPLIVHDALMIEPTETESKQTLDAFADALIKIAEEAHTQPELLKSAPHNTPVRRVDEVKAAKDLVLCCWLPEEQQ
ncbi:aminomethyl-transferring glycine dehydrogenase subunit GcvPB [Anaerolinea thermophila]|uniref:Probable glycine dehydrogenase (decarboxylating) subunit 2 n=1 Tax=Anaerolinea thermophila (strain DSM 14523 / JCM 11388 / NBRC 100420 / UNI-1) TaxID=926569 RepID=E8N5J2_ANATU|nr:aminomethyl-transferring glycine dehydrogenase subunit GcvPB [Anaerolinea thermophila]BAJ63706.1 glycine dehydrogenase [decarboxylating] subunit 2 [Anaerolinea thermophila UNI-1]